MTREEKQSLTHAIKLHTTEGYTVHVIRRLPDSITRVCCGGNNAVLYCTYRGRIDDAINAVRNSLAALVALKKGGKEPMIAPDPDKAPINGHDTYHDT